MLSESRLIFKYEESFGGKKLNETSYHLEHHDTISKK